MVTDRLSARAAQPTTDPSIAKRRVPRLAPIRARSARRSAARVLVVGAVTAGVTLGAFGGVATAHDAAGTLACGPGADTASWTSFPRLDVASWQMTLDGAVHAKGLETVPAQTGADVHAITLADLPADGIHHTATLLANRGSYRPSLEVVATFDGTCGVPINRPSPAASPPGTSSPPPPAPLPASVSVTPPITPAVVRQATSPRVRPVKRHPRSLAPKARPRRPLDCYAVLRQHPRVGVKWIRRCGGPIPTSTLPAVAG